MAAFKFLLYSTACHPGKNPVSAAEILEELFICGYFSTVLNVSFCPHKKMFSKGQPYLFFEYFRLFKKCLFTNFLQKKVFVKQEGL
ncbi:hypothetical protein AF332_10575 [Sporosarcina globispora]|uniref:Uncharacterized protein n=1 Tax=Sporosarcina globispora TaxID=1459 RepID=A0A0M0GCE9_SPOGL|nr:hypothetical protein AF332_10575 [Sporosarcina globispora]